MTGWLVDINRESLKEPKLGLDTARSADEILDGYRSVAGMTV
jgi:hypothetical protein